MAEKTRLAISIDVTGIPQLTKLKAALSNASASSKVLGGQFGRTRNELKLLERSIKPSVNSTRALRDSFRELSNQVEFGGRAFRQATREADRLDKQLRRMEQRRAPRFSARNIGQTAGTIAAGGVFGGPEGALGGIGGAIVGSIIPGIGTVAGAAAGAALGAQVGGVRQAAGEAASYAAQLNKLRIALKGVTTSQAEYEDGLAFVTKSSRQFAIPQDIILRQFTKLQASVQGAGGSLEETKEVFTGMVAALRATGGNLQDVDSALTATAQVFSKGKVSAEELRQQIGERLPGAFTLFADSMGKTPQELDKALEKGEVSLQDFLKFSQDIFERYGEAAETIVKSPSAAGARLAMEMAELKETIGKSLQPIGALFQNLAATSVRFLNSIIKKAQELARTLGNLAAPLAGAIGSVVGGPFGPLLGALGRQGISQLQALGSAGVDPDITQPGAGGGLPDITPGDGAGAGGRGRRPMSMQLANALIAARREENEKRQIALALEARILAIKEQQLDPARELNEIDKASFEAREALQAVDAKRAKDLKDLLESFKVRTGQFDMNAQAERKTPFDALREGADAFTDSLKGTLGAAKELATVGLQGISDGITNLVVNGTLNFREFAASLLRDMARIIMQQVVMKTLFQAIGFGGGGVNATDYMLGNAPQLNASGVNIGSSAFGLPAFANGGITRGVSIAGEAGPEAIVPLPDGRTIPVKMQGEGAKVIVNVDAQGTTVEGDTAGANRLGEAIGTAVRQELLKQKRPGGLLA